MYVCMYICLYVCLYVCVVCMYVWMDVCSQTWVRIRVPLCEIDIDRIVNQCVLRSLEGPQSRDV